MATPTHTTRRALLASVPAVAAPAPESEILRLFREYRDLVIAGNAHEPTDPATETEEMDRLFWNRTREIEAQMLALPSTSAADFAAKVIVNTMQGDAMEPWETGALWIEARALTGWDNLPA